MDLDAMLKELGQFGRYQFFCFFLLMFPVTMCGYCTMEYVFLTLEIPHRCRVPECEGLSTNVQFLPAWLDRAVPFTEDQEPQECQRYLPRGNASSECPAELFDTNVTIHCSDWVFEEPTHTLIQEFKLLCEEDEWERTTVGTYGMLMAMIGIPLAGIISDRLGRKVVLVVGSLLIVMLELYRSFITHYDAFIHSQLVIGLLGGTIYFPSFIIGLEMLSPQKRLLGSMLINIYFCMGEVLLGLVMWWAQDWRLLLRLLYFPMLVLISLFWLLPESIRWLYARGRYQDVKRILTSIAEANKTTDKLPTVLANLDAVASNKDPGSCEDDPLPSRRVHYIQVLKSRVILLRLVACCLCWMAMLFTYYGLSLDSVSVAGNRYVNFILVSLVELPAYIVSLWLPDWSLLGRRWSTAGSFFLTGAASLAFFLLHEGMEFWHDVLLLTSKFCSTLTLSVIYLYTTEVFPTELRTSLMSLCSMVGRLGQLFVPQIPILAEHVEPMVVFAVVSVVGGALALTCPETLNTKLPDTIQEAEDIGKPATQPQPSTG